jgi:hypothetical protein
LFELLLKIIIIYFKPILGLRAQLKLMFVRVASIKGLKGY